MLYRFNPVDGELRETNNRLQLSLSADLPLSRVVVGVGTSADGNDQFFVLVPERGDHHVLARTRTRGRTGIFTGQTTIDEGVGTENGQTLTPVVLALDRQRQRLFILEAQGRLQVFDAASNVERRYLTKWGRFGAGAGEFLVGPEGGTALVVDSQGVVYVADGTGRIQVFEP